jgi:pyruvate-formate lyase-activating enzyme
MNLFYYQNYGRLWRVYIRSFFRYATGRKTINALRTELAYRRRNPRPSSLPYILFLEPLYYCNLDCPLCDRQIFPDARKNDAGKMSLEFFDRLLDDIGDYLFQCQIFGQGEPLLDWPLTQAIIQKSHARKIFTLVSTNCTLASPQIAEELVVSGLDHLVCAIDGITQKTYGQYRAGGHVEDAMTGMRNFVEARRRKKGSLEIEWQFLLHKGNAHELPAARKLAKELGVFFRPSPLRGMEFDPELQQAWLQDVPAGERQTGDNPVGESISPWPCYFLWRALTLNSNHKLARCLVYQNVAEFADLNHMSAREAFRHPTMVRARELFSRKPVAPGEFPAPCANCSFYQRTHGGPNLDKHASLARARPAVDAFLPTTALTISPRRTRINSATTNESPAEQALVGISAADENTRDR